MNRGVGVTDLLTDLPTVVVVVFAVLTQLGDFWFVATASVLTYWLASATPPVKSTVVVTGSAPRLRTVTSA